MERVVVNRDGYTDDPVAAAEQMADSEAAPCPYFSVRGLPSCVFPLRYIPGEFALVDAHGMPLADFEYGSMPDHETHAFAKWVADVMNKDANATREAEAVVARMPD